MKYDIHYGQWNNIRNQWKYSNSHIFYRFLNLALLKTSVYSAVEVRVSLLSEIYIFIFFFFFFSNYSNDPLLFLKCPRGLTFTWCDVTIYVWHKPTEVAHSFLFCSCVCFCLYGPFNCISFHKFSRQLSAFSLCSSGLIFALLVLSIIYLFMKVSLSPDICGWLGLKHQQTN